MSIPSMGTRSHPTQGKTSILLKIFSYSTNVVYCFLISCILFLFVRLFCYENNIHPMIKWSHTLIVEMDSLSPSVPPANIKWLLPNTWLRSAGYLTDHNNIIYVECTLISPQSSLNCGVSQGSDLVPLLFTHSPMHIVPIIWHHLQMTRTFTRQLIKT